MLLVNYYTNSAGPTPPPLNLLLLPSRMSSTIRKWCRGNEAAAAAAALAAKSARAREVALREGAGRVPLGQESRDETRAYHAYLQERDARKAAESGARVDRVTSIVQGLEFKQMEDRESLDKHMQRITQELDWLKQQVSHVPRGGGHRYGASERKFSRRALHRRARSELNVAYKGQRLQVPDWRVPWEVDWPSYEPIEFTDSTVLARPSWADPPDASEVRAARGCINWCATTHHSWQARIAQAYSRVFSQHCFPIPFYFSVCNILAQSLNAQPSFLLLSIGSPISLRAGRL